MEDIRIRKFSAMGDEGDSFLGMSCITNELESWPLIEPEYFYNEYPEEAKRDDIWYVGFAYAAPDAGRAVLPALLAAMYPLSKNGITVMDFCTYNEDAKLPEYTRRILSRINPLVGMHRKDAQNFWCIDFKGEA
jgi:hypothetical protein